MRRLTVVMSAVLLAVLIASSTALAVQAQSAEQYEPSDGSEAPPEPTDSKAPSEPSPGANSISQGSIAKVDSAAAKAVQQDIAEEEKLPDYSQIVDNSTEGRFSAPGWTERSGDWSHEGNYVAASSGAGPATFKFRVPTTSDYSVYAWWPGASGNSTSADYVVPTAGGSRTSTVDQSLDGGMWVKLGTYELQSGEAAIELSGEGQVVADAVSIVRGDVAVLPEAADLPEGGAAAPAAPTARSTTDSRARKGNRRLTGRGVVRRARSFIKDRYSWGTCTPSRKSCTCVTKKSVEPFGHRMSMGEARQWRYNGSRKIRKSRLRPGDEVFFKEGGGRRITHVGIYSGNGNIIHASTYFGKVVESKMKYINGYSGAKRFKKR